MATLPSTTTSLSPTDWTRFLGEVLPPQGNWSETISVLKLHGDAYAEAGLYRRGETASSVLLAGFSLDVAAVLDAD